MPKRPITSAAQRQRFLELYAEAGTVEGACAQMQLDSRQHRRWLQQSPDYRDRFAQAQNKATDKLLTEARRRAMGFQEEVFFQGLNVGHVTRYSDLLMMFLLKGARPLEFRDNYRTDVNLNANLHHQVVVNVIHEFRDSPATILDLKPQDSTIQLPPAPDPDPDFDR